MVTPVSGSGYLAASCISSDNSKAISSETESGKEATAAGASQTAESVSSAETDKVVFSSEAQQWMTAFVVQASSSDTNNAVDSASRGSSFDIQSPQFEKDVTLPDGKQALQLGDVDSSEDYVHKQGDNDLHYEGDCGLVACGDVANQFGKNVSENDVVHYAADNNLCVSSGDPKREGATTITDQERVLDGLGVPAHIESGNTLKGLGKDLEEGHGAIIEVNAGELWNNPDYYDSGKTNHAVTVTGVAIDPSSGEAEGAWIDDSGNGSYDEYVSVDNPALQDWANNGSPSIVTDGEHNNIDG